MALFLEMKIYLSSHGTFAKEDKGEYSWKPVPGENSLEEHHVL